MKKLKTTKCPKSERELHLEADPRHSNRQTNRQPTANLLHVLPYIREESMLSIYTQNK